MSAVTSAVLGGFPGGFLFEAQPLSLLPLRRGRGVQLVPEVTGPGCLVAVVLTFGAAAGARAVARMGCRGPLGPGCGLAALAGDFRLGLMPPSRSPSQEGSPQLPRPGRAVRRDPECCPSMSCES